MAGESYWYFTKYKPDFLAALNQLKEQEFLAGRYNPAMPYPFSSEAESLTSPGAKHKSMEEALMASAEFAEGTRSILDIHHISAKPWTMTSAQFFNLLCEASDLATDLLFTSFPLTEQELVRFLKTEQPTRELVNSVILNANYLDPGYQFWSTIERGTARHIVVYKNSVPDEIFFAGYSFD